MKRIALFLFLILASVACFAQTQIDPTYQIQWDLLSGSGAPSISCTQNGNYTVYPYGAAWGQSYQDTTNNVEYKCTASGWVKNLPSTGGTLTGPLNGTSASFSGTVVAGSETLGSPLLPASGGTGATTKQGAATAIVDGSAINPSSIGQTGTPGPAIFSTVCDKTGYQDVRACFGAKGDGQDHGVGGTVYPEQPSDGVCSPASAIWTSSSSTFTSADIGKSFYSPLTGTTTIRSIGGTHSVTLSTTCGAGGTVQPFVYGTDDTAAIASCFSNYQSCYIPGFVFTVLPDVLSLNGPGWQVITGLAPGLDGVARGAQFIPLAPGTALVTVSSISGTVGKEIDNIYFNGGNIVTYPLNLNGSSGFITTHNLVYGNPAAGGCDENVAPAGSNIQVDYINQYEDQFTPGNAAGICEVNLNNSQTTHFTLYNPSFIGSATTTSLINVAHGKIQLKEPVFAGYYTASSNVDINNISGIVTIEGGHSENFDTFMTVGQQAVGVYLTDFGAAHGSVCNPSGTTLCTSISVANGFLGSIITQGGTFDNIVDNSTLPSYPHTFYMEQPNFTSGATMSGGGVYQIKFLPIGYGCVNPCAVGNPGATTNDMGFDMTDANGSIYGRVSAQTTNGSGGGYSQLNLWNRVAGTPTIVASANNAGFYPLFGLQLGAASLVSGLGACNTYTAGLVREATDLTTTTINTIAVGSGTASGPPSPVWCNGGNWLTMTGNPTSGLSGMTQYGLAVAATASTVTSSVQPASWTSGHTFVPAWQPSGSALAPVALDLATWATSYGALTATGNQTLTNPNTVSGLPSGCQQYPCVVAKVGPALITTLSGTGLNPLYAIPSGGAGVYRSCETLTATVAGSSGSYNIYINGYTDGHSANLGAIGPVNATPQWGTADGCQTLYLDASQNVLWQIYGTVVGTPTFRYTITLERLQ